MFDISEVVTSLLLGLAIFTGVLTILHAFRRPAPISDDDLSSESERRLELSRVSIVFCNFEDLLISVANLNKKLSDSSSRQKIQQSLVRTGNEAPWKPEEFMACKQLESTLAGVVVGLVFIPFSSLLAALVVGLVVAFVMYLVEISKLHSKGDSRVRTFKLRLPFTVDLLALMLEAGATFTDALATAVRENAGHPIGEEFGLAERHISLGRRRSEALESLSKRMQDQDVQELVFAINKGEELGTPLAHLLRDQADQMLLKRSQWGEKAAAEAEVQLAFPGFMVMLACMLIVVAPIIFPLLAAFNVI